MLNFRNRGVEVAVHEKKFFSEEHLQWANLVIAAGGKQGLVAMATTFSALTWKFRICCCFFFIQGTETS